MIGWIIALSVLVLLAVVLLLRVGVQVEYNREEIAVRLRIGSSYRQLVPKKPKNKKQGKKQIKSPRKSEKPKQKGGTLGLIWDLLPLALRTIRQLCGKLRVDKLDLVLTVGAEDPGDAALQYGRANALLGSLWQPIVSVCHVVDGHARVDVDFEAKQPVVYLLAELSLRIGQLLLLALAFAVQALAILVRRTKKMTPD